MAPFTVFVTLYPRWRPTLIALLAVLLQTAASSLPGVAVAAEVRGSPAYRSEDESASSRLRATSPLKHACVF